MAPAVRTVADVAQLASSVAAVPVTSARPSQNSGSPDGTGIGGETATLRRSRGGEADIAERLLQDGEIPHRRRTRDCISEACAAELLLDDADDFFTAVDGLQEGGGAACVGPGLTAALAEHRAPQMPGSFGGSTPMAAPVDEAVPQPLLAEHEGGSREFAHEEGGGLGGDAQWLDDLEADLGLGYDLD